MTLKVDPNPTPREYPEPDHQQFNLAMMAEQEFINLLDGTNASARWLENLLMNRSTNWPLIILLWGQISQEATISAEAIARWNDHARAANMPLQFQSDGRVQYVSA